MDLGTDIDSQAVRLSEAVRSVCRDLTQSLIETCVYSVFHIHTPRKAASLTE